MKKNYQTKTAAAATAVEPVMPDAVSVTLTEQAGSLREGLLALAVGAGFQVMDAIIEQSVTALAGEKGRHDPDRTAVRHSTEDGSVALGGRRVPIRRPRVRTPDKTAEVAVPAYELFSSTDVLSAMALERMMAKLSTRPLRGRPGAGRSSDRGGRPVHVEVGDLAAVRGRHRVGAGRHARPHDRRYALRRSPLSVVALGIGIDGTKPVGPGRGRHSPGCARSRTRAATCTPIPPMSSPRSSISTV
jgi:hypothetical protein